ncbi:cAMP-regulated phosphoprotein 21 [Clydaea vesicula]|uniref:cAMP-regulated phosphoprotein 21 n=1 Tax=Clydaea vesicula TaxID=447962 RepID=A0AAD5TUH4_9FUNG|nr:cAMP-regulated phosphoprotein 21 [Clydaea vesicula]
MMGSVKENEIVDNSTLNESNNFEYQQQQSTQHSQQASNKDLKPLPSTEVSVDPETGIDIFLLSTVKNQKDRLFVLKIDLDLEAYALDSSRTKMEFPGMNSYQRLIIHRIAHLYGMAHVVDANRRAVIIYKTTETRVPSTLLRNIPMDEEPKDSKRQNSNDSNSNTSYSSPKILPNSNVRIMQRGQRNNRPNHNQYPNRANTNHRTNNGKSIEEREAAYNELRAEIFQDDDSSNQSADNSNYVDKSNYQGNSQSARNPYANPRPRVPSYYNSQYGNVYQPNLYNSNGAMKHNYMRPPMHPNFYYGANPYANPEMYNTYRPYNPNQPNSNEDDISQMPPPQTNPYNQSPTYAQPYADPRYPPFMPFPYYGVPPSSSLSSQGSQNGEYEGTVDNIENETETSSNPGSNSFCHQTNFFLDQLPEMMPQMYPMYNPEYGGMPAPTYIAPGYPYYPVMQQYARPPPQHYFGHPNYFQHQTPSNYANSQASSSNFDHTDLKTKTEENNNEIENLTGEVENLSMKN